MGTGASQWGRGIRRIGVTLLVGLVIGGCSRKTSPPAPTSPDASVASASQVAVPSPAVDPRLQQPFAEATLADPPGEWQRPPDLTMTNKSVGKLYTEVARLWDDIRFVAPSGKRLAYRATLDTELGQIEITLWPDVAPNHVRSFVALARAGYYDGLVFERTLHEPVEGQPNSRLELIEAGCPLGTGEPGYGSIGYWLRPEFSDQVKHEEGVVGACHGEEADTAACKFYINLGNAPFLDGSYTLFGKVTQGLDVARKILSLPVRNDPEYPEGDRPVKPVVIRKVTIQTAEVDNPAP